MPEPVAIAQPLLSSPPAVLAALAGLVALVFVLDAWGGLAAVFRRLPAVFWVYFLPMVATSLGLLPEASPLYSAMTRYLLPASLALVLLSADLRSIAALGPRALGAMGGGVTGIVAGSVISFVLLSDHLGPEAWKIFAALTGTWTGGSANLLAVATALELSPDSQGLAILVDTLVGYSWMGMLIALSGSQAMLDRRLRADRQEVAAIATRMRDRVTRDRRPMTIRDAALLIGIALVVSAASMSIGRELPVVGAVLTPFSWGILVLTTIALLLSLTPLARLEGAGASSLGYAAFYLLLASVGAQADVRKLLAAPMWVLAGAIILVVHGVVLFVTLRLMRAPSFFLGAASQACIGGTASAPVVAELYQPGLAPVGLLLAVLGTVFGTYVGLLTGQLLFLLAGS